MAAREGTETLGNAYGAPRTPADDAHAAQLARRAYRALPQNTTPAARLAVLAQIAKESRTDHQCDLAALRSESSESSESSLVLVAELRRASAERARPAVEALEPNWQTQGGDGKPKACEVRRVGEEWRCFKSQNDAWRAYPDLTKSELNSLIINPTGCSSELRLRFEARLVAALPTPNKIEAGVETVFVDSDARQASPFLAIGAPGPPSPTAAEPSPDATRPSPMDDNDSDDNSITLDQMREKARIRREVTIVGPATAKPITATPASMSVSPSVGAPKQRGPRDEHGRFPCPPPPPRVFVPGDRVAYVSCASACPGTVITPHEGGLLRGEGVVVRLDGPEGIIMTFPPDVGRDRLMGPIGRVAMREERPSTMTTSMWEQPSLSQEAMTEMARVVTAIQQETTVGNRSTYNTFDELAGIQYLPSEHRKAVRARAKTALANAARSGGGAAAAETFSVGDVVEANYGGEGHWYPGRIASCESGVSSASTYTRPESRLLAIGAPPGVTAASAMLEKVQYRLGQIERGRADLRMTVGERGPVKTEFDNVVSSLDDTRWRCVIAARNVVKRSHPKLSLLLPEKHAALIIQISNDLPLRSRPCSFTEIPSVRAFSYPPRLRFESDEGYLHRCLTRAEAIFEELLEVWARATDEVDGVKQKIGHAQVELAEEEKKLAVLNQLLVKLEVMRSS